MIVTVLLIVVTCVVSFQAFNRKGLAMKLAMWPPAVQRERQYWRFLTYGFVHADMQHLLFNMITLFFFGQAVEMLLSSHIGSLGFALFYLSAVALSILPSYQKHRNDARYVSVGASGAVSAILFSFVLFSPEAVGQETPVLPLALHGGRPHGQFHGQPLAVESLERHHAGDDDEKHGDDHGRAVHGGGKPSTIEHHEPSKRMPETGAAHENWPGCAA